MANSPLRVLITGADGFIGKNLLCHLREDSNFEPLKFTRGDDLNRLASLVKESDAIVHLAGENRPADDSAFVEVNVGLTQKICELVEREIEQGGRTLPLLFASSTQAELENPYGESKREAERAISKLAQESNNPCSIYRLPGVFGKWCKPNYNSVVATFCHSVANDLPIEVHDPLAQVRLVFIDDVVKAMIGELLGGCKGLRHRTIAPEYSIAVGELAEHIQAFKGGRDNLCVGRVGTGFQRALYATYITYLQTENFKYAVPKHSDPRGNFVEMLKTADSGQISYFTARPGVTRGRHYHHTKTEKFLVIQGSACFRFRHLISEEVAEIYTNGEEPEIVETIPGWTHDITNVGSEDLLVMLWANEVFDPEAPDTIPSEI